MWMVKGIYNYRKDHTVESIIFTPWSKKVIPFSSIRHKVQAFQDDKRHEMTLPWNDGTVFQFSAPPKMPRNLRKRTTGKIITRWLDNNRFNPIKTRRPNTQEAKVPDLDTIDTGIEAPVLVKVWDRFGLLCSYCKQGAPHPSSQESVWSIKDWDGTKAKRKEETKETNLLSDWDLPKPKPNINQKTDIDELALSKLQVGQNDLKEEQVNVTESLIPLLTTKALEEMTEKTDDELTKAEKRDQQEKEKYAMYQRMYIGQLSEEEKSDTESDYLGSSYFN